MSTKYKGLSVDLYANDLTLKITRNAVMELAPEELDFVEDFIYIKDFQSDKDDALAFGVGELVAPLTPAIWSAIGAGLSYCMVKLFDASVDIGKDLAKDWVKNKVDCKSPGKLLLQPELKAEVQAVVIAQALKYGLNEKQAARLSVILIERLNNNGE